MEIFGIGLPEMLVIAIVALIVLGPDRLPEAARTLGKGVRDLRQALEPARSAWAEVTREIATAVELPANVTGNPWTVHPIAEGLSPEERVRFFATGEIPPWKQQELAKLDAVRGNGSVDAATTEGLPDIDYPMPHATLAYQPAPLFTEPLEELDYPEPERAAPPTPLEADREAGA